MYLNRGYKKATDHPIDPNRRPDVTVVKKSGKVDAIEVQSASDKPEILRARNEEAMDQLPYEKQGRINLIKSTSEKKQ